jgi:ssDNA-binding Zn-finger/Zn-ribbon topoisomerase 1
MSMHYQLPVKKPGDPCPACGKGIFVIKGSRYVNSHEKRKLFLGCSRYPQCKYSVSGRSANIPQEAYEQIGGRTYRKPKNKHR